MTFFDYPIDESDAAPTLAPDSLLPHASENDWADLLRFFTIRHLEPGEALVSLGESDRSLFLVMDGTLDVLQPTRHGRWRRVSTVVSGSVLGELAFFDREERSATVRALTSTSVARMTADEFADLADSRPDLALLIAMDLGRILANRLRRKEASLATAS